MSPSLPVITSPEAWGHWSSSLFVIWCTLYVWPEDYKLLHKALFPLQRAAHIMEQALKQECPEFKRHDLDAPLHFFHALFLSLARPAVDALHFPREAIPTGQTTIHSGTSTLLVECWDTCTPILLASKGAAGVNTTSTTSDLPQFSSKEVMPACQGLLTRQTLSIWLITAHYLATWKVFLISFLSFCDYSRSSAMC
jgi:hypothetical protein